MPGISLPSDDERPVDSLSTIAQVEEALSAAIASGAAIEAALEDQLCNGEGTTSERALTLSKTAQRAAAISDDASELLEVLESASRRAHTVSHRVRHLDSALGRARAALSRVEDILSLRVCAEGAKTALSSHDLAAAARYVASYRKLNEDVRTDASSAPAVAQMLQSIAELSRKVRENADTVLEKYAAADVNTATSTLSTVLEAVRLFVPVGMPEEGLKRLSDALCAQIARETEIDIRNLRASVSSDDGPSGADEVHIVALARLFEAVVAYLHACKDDVRQNFGQESLVSLVGALQKQCDVYVEKIFDRYMEARRMEELARAVRAETANAPDLGPLLDELTVLSQRIASYFQFLRDNYSNSALLEASKEEDGKEESSGAREDSSSESQIDIENIIKQSKLASWFSQLSTRYIAIEGYFMRENARKAIRIDEPGGEEAETSTAVDDFFFVIRTCTQRAMAFGNMCIETNFSILQNINACLKNDLTTYIRKRLRETETALEQMMGGTSSSTSLPAAALGMTFLTEFAKANMAKAGVGETDASSELEPAKYDFFVALNNCSVSSQYAMRFRTNIEKTIAAAGMLSSEDRSRLNIPLGFISDAASSLSSLAERGVGQLSAILTGRISSAVDSAISSASYVVTDAENPADDSLAGTVTDLVEARVLHKPLEKRLGSDNWDALVRRVAQWTASTIESGVFLQSADAPSKSFSALGGLRADRDVRALSAYFAGKSKRGTVRDVFSRLSQIAMLLNLERPAEVYDIWGQNAGGMTWRLTRAEVQRVMMLRKDFSNEAVKALRL